MKKFSEFGITLEQKSFTGEKVSINRVLNREIVVHAFKIEDSKYEGKRLSLQISLSGTKHVLWSGSTFLQEMIQRIPADGFPFETTIVEVDKKFMFK